MLHIILLILKIIGIAILVIIGLLLLILLTVLLVPIRYRAEVQHGEVITANVKITWLLHILCVSISYLEGKLHIRLRVFWLVIFDNLKSKQPKAKKDKRKSRKRKKKVRINTTRREERKPAGKVETIPDEDITEQSIIDSTSDPTKVIHHDTISMDEIDTNSCLDKDDTSIFKKIIIKINHLKQRIISFFKNLKGKISKSVDKLSNIKKKFNLIMEFIRDEYNKEGFHVTWNSLKKLFRHILPTYLKSRIIFGTGDPCSTGQALGAMSILYSFYGDKIIIIPDFDNKRLEGEHFVRGRIRLITVLIIVIKLILDKRFKQLRINFKILKEAL